MCQSRSPLGSEATANHHSSFGEADHRKSEAEEAGKLQNVSGGAHHRCSSTGDLCSGPSATAGRSRSESTDEHSCQGRELRRSSADLGEKVGLGDGNSSFSRRTEALLRARRNYTTANSFSKAPGGQYAGPRISGWCEYPRNE